MYTFTYWHAYFDSIFLKPGSKLPSSFISELHLQKAPQKKWNQCPLLPELPSLLFYLQKFIITSSWKACQCEQIQMKLIQSQLNSLLVLIQCQKIYSIQYWEMNQRRVQASFVHYYIILKLFILAIIPEGCDNLSEALLTKKLCIQINKIEDLINHFLVKLRSIHSFMHHKIFQEEASLTAELFNSITHFWQCLPQITKQQLTDIPKIMRYICLNNPLDTLQIGRSKNRLELRKKSETIENKKQMIRERQKSESDRNSNSILPLRKFFESADKNKSTILQKQRLKQKRELQFFKFKKQLYLPNNNKYSKNLNKLQKHDTLSKKKQLFSSQDLQRFRSVTIQQRGDLVIQNNRNQNKLDRTTVQKKIVGIQLRDRMSTMTMNNDYRLQRSKRQFQRIDEHQIERIMVKKGNKGVKKMQKYDRISKLIHLQTGQTKGWGRIREDLEQNIVKRKLKKLLNL